MFRYNHDKLLDHKKLGGTQHSWVCPYKEGYNENEWVVKYIHAKNQTEMNDILQNIFLTTSSGFSGLVPIKGYDVQAAERGDYNIYCKQPRMMASLKNVMNREYSADNLIGSTEKLVLLLHSLVSTLDDMAQQRTFHRNLKPTNILVDKLGHPLLSDLRMLQSSSSNNDDLSTESENLMYIAPEVLSGSWAAGEDDDIHKSDVWSLGMIMARLCLLDKLTPIPTDVPLQEAQEAIDRNIEAIKNRYGVNLSRILSTMLDINSASRNTFGEIRSMLEETFVYTLEKNDKVVSKGHYGDSDYQDHSYSDPFLKANTGSTFRKRGNFEINLDYENPEAESFRTGNQTYQKFKNIFSSVGSKIFKGAKDFKEGRGGQMYEKAKELKGSIGSRICRKFQYFKDVGRFLLYDKICNGVNFMKTHKYKILGVMMTILFIVAVILGLRWHGISQREKYDRAIKGISIKLEESLRIFNSEGALVVELKEKYKVNQDPLDYYGYRREQELLTTGYVNSFLEFVSAVKNELELANVLNLLTSLKMKSLRYLLLEPDGLTNITNGLAPFKALNKFEFTQISGDSLNVTSLTEFTNSLATELPKLQSFGMGLIGCPDVSEISPVASQIFTDFKYLKELKLELEEIPVEDSDMKRLASVISQNGQSLTSLTIKISSCNSVEAEGFTKFTKEFSKGLKNLVYLSLDFSNAKITDAAIIELSDGISRQCKYLKSLLIKVSESPAITSKSIKYLAHKLNSTPIKGLERFWFNTGGWVRLSYEEDYIVRNDLNNIRDVYWN